MGTVQQDAGPAPIGRHSGGPIRVLLLGPLPPPYGGPEVMTRALLDGLRDVRELEVQHVDMQVSRSLADKGGQRPLQKSLLGLTQAARVTALIWRFRPAIVYLPLTNSPSFLGFLRDCLFILPALLARRKVAVRLHGGHYFYVHTTGIARRVVHAVLSRVSLVLVQGRNLVSIFDGFVPRDRIAIVPNGLDDPCLESLSTRPRPPHPPGSPKRVLFVGLLCQEKGVDEILQAIPQVPNADFLFVGEWKSEEEDERAQRFIARHGVASRARFAGVLTGRTKAEAFASADIFVFPTYFVYEGHAVSSVEALAAGLPIVCTDRGALSESVEDGWNGYFVPPRDSSSLAARLNELVANDSLRRVMGERSRRRYLDRFTLKHFVTAWTASIVGCAEGRVPLEPGIYRSV